MRQDQIDRLNDLAERLADRFITDADPVNWSAADKLPRDMTQQERGDAYWSKKNAMATGGVLRYTLDLIEGGKGSASSDPETQRERDADLDKRIGDAEKKAAAAMARVMDKAKGKAEFDKRVHGKQQG